MSFLKNDRSWAASIDPKISMSTRQFLWVFFSHQSTILYLVLSAILLAISLNIMESWWQFFGSLALVIVIYPVVEFCLHRFVLHSRALYRQPWTAALWRRIHYDHHMNPNDLSVLFGAPYTTIPAVVVPTLPVGYLAFGWPGAITAIAGGFLALTVYEFFHCAAHLPVRFTSPMMQFMRRHHSLHHFHSEVGNYGIVTNVMDKLVGTEYESARDMGASPTVKNLGYTEEETRKYPWVAALDGKEGHPGKA